MNKLGGLADNTVYSYKCARCGNMFEARRQVASTCPICGYSCRENLCTEVNASDEGY